jgi:hypothetical protein
MDFLQFAKLPTAAFTGVVRPVFYCMMCVCVFIFPVRMYVVGYATIGSMNGY